MADMKFTPAQEQAMAPQDGSVLVSAAAGSGKTRVLVERLLRRVLDPTQGKSIDDFLVITFTKKAAAELRSRIAKALGDRLAEHPGDRHAARQLSRLALAQITTIDSFCSDLVRRNAFALHVSPDFRQLEQEESALLQQSVAAAVLEQSYAAPEEDPGFLQLVDTVGAGRNDTVLEQTLLELYRSSRSHLYPDAWIERCIAQLDLSRYTDVSQTPWGKVLLRSFRRFCESKLCVMEAAIRLCAEDPILQERYVPVLTQEAAQLRRLADESSWDALCAFEPEFVKKMPTIKSAEKSDLQPQVAELRKKCKAALLDRLTEFYAPSAVVLAELTQTGESLRALFRLARRFEHAYQREKHRLRVLDFSDLEHGAVQLLLHPDGTPRPLAKELSAQYAEIMLDEYQDTNEVQDRLFAAISRNGSNLFLVGDVKQAIYRFRLADPGIFLEKYRTFQPYAEARPGQPRKILLSENFRSGPEILEAANAVFSACMSEQVGGLKYGEDERLRLGLPKDPLPDRAVELHCIDTKPEGFSGKAPDKTAVEAEFVARRIRRLLDEGTKIRDGDTLRPVEPKDIAILQRSMQNTAQPFVDALRAHGIPCASERESALLDAPELETLVCLLQLIDNARQDIPLCSVLLSPFFGMQADTLAALRGSRELPLYDALRASDAPEAVQFITLLSRLRTASQTLELSALVSFAAAELHLEERYALLPDGEDRQRDLYRFIALAAAFSEGGKKSLTQFLARLDTLRSQQSAPQRQPNAVRLMSIHKSKGLEFPVVILAGLSRSFNEMSLRASVLLHPELGAGGNVYDTARHFHYHSAAKRAIIAQEREDARSEELRVLYVAMTRAKSRLIMTYCGSAVYSRLRQLAVRLTLPPEPLIAADAVCPGDWVLEAALLRTEAGELFRAGARPVETAVSALPWCIRYHTATALEGSAAASAAAPPARQLPPLEQLEAAANFVYPCQAAAKTPSKITATQLKGRRMDDEISEGSAVRTAAARQLRRPCFDQDRPLSAAERGTATHLAMQYLDFSKTADVAQIQQELQRLVKEAFLTPQQAEAVSPERLYRIFSGPVGARIAAADEVIREFKFSLLTDAGIYAEGVGGEKMLLQGVTDCCLIKDGGLCVIDFKTDRVRPGQEMQAAQRYRGQLEAYSLALERIFGLPVTEKLLYFFATDTPVCLP